MTISMSSATTSDDDNLYQTHTVSFTNVDPHVAVAVKAQLEAAVELGKCLERQRWSLDSNRASWQRLDEKVAGLEFVPAAPIHVAEKGAE